jgi:hypothetical protein
LTGTPWEAGQHTNTATANGSYNTTTVSDTDDANYFGAEPKIDVEKYVSVDGGGTWEDADTATGPSLLTGNNPQFKFVVKNDGNVDLSNITLSDSDFSLDGLTGDTTTGNNQYNIATLAAGASTEVLLTGTPWEAGQHTNTATANGSYNTTTVSDTDDANYSSEKGLGKTPGFWKQSQHFQYWPGPYTPSKSFSETFLGADQTGDKFTYGGVQWFNDSLLGALSAEDLKGSTGSNAVKLNGNVSALGRSATAALLNATSDELNNNVKGSDIKYIIDPRLLLPEVVTFLSTKVDGIFDANGVQTLAGDGIISSVEVLNAVKDVFNSGGGLYGKSDVNTLATAFDKMNNMAGG